MRRGLVDWDLLAVEPEPLRRPLEPVNEHGRGAVAPAVDGESGGLPFLGDVAQPPRRVDDQAMVP